jgi:hypothetical protein
LIRRDSRRRAPSRLPFCARELHYETLASPSSRHENRSTNEVVHCWTCFRLALGVSRQPRPANRAPAVSRHPSGCAGLAVNPRPDPQQRYAKGTGSDHKVK